MTTTSAPFGSWPSPIAAADLAVSGHPISGGRYFGDGIWWLEQRPTEAGRYLVRRRDDAGEHDVLPAPWNARSRVHEYGGGSWAVTDDGVLVFVEFTDQRLYRLDPGSAEPVALTPAGRGFRFGELAIRDDRVIAVRENVGPSGEEEGPVTRDIVSVPLDGSAADDPDAIVSVVSGSDFLAYPRYSPDGTTLAWIAWDHPRMPWDGTELRVGALDADGRVASFDTLIGGPEESVLQPEWIDGASLFALTDRSGWWNPVRVTTGASADDVAGGEVTEVYRRDADIGGPLWQIGSGFYRVLPGGDLLAVSTVGGSELLRIGSDGATSAIDLPISSRVEIADLRDGRVLLTGAGATVPGGLRELDLATGDLRDIRLDVDDLPDARYLPQSRPLSFPVGDREVHAFVYPPTHPDYVGPEGELPPYVAFVHGGPTAHVSGGLSLTYAYFTSRGIGVIDINYGGSSGYGRAYRELLRGQWGIVDVVDTAAAMQGLADAGLADPGRLAIRGGSAGGWTVLACLTSTDVFACGASYFGVADLTGFAESTHDFESRYLEGLIGPAEDVALYAERAPINKVDGLSAPVLLLQGLDDRIVPPEQSRVFRDALLAKGIAHAYREYAGESHGFRRAETIIDATESELSFYGQILGFTPPGVPLLELWRP
ncbi:alpha/beta hydrolase family protein [Millisia brevis]|uniref:alpha/beta hydrolase family protein n=1 Tax=Millisia brevis TaxID=264148 RepID=UPI000832FF83|nr:prolyl oligopeptidase family serine peptidase [Millisia brevis]